MFTDYELYELIKLKIIFIKKLFYFVYINSIDLIR